MTFNNNLNTIPMTTFSSEMFLTIDLFRLHK
jgi:hypothetical protein